MNPVRQNPMESAIIEGVAQIHPTIAAAIVELISADDLYLADALD